MIRWQVGSRHTLIPNIIRWANMLSRVVDSCHIFFVNPTLLLNQFQFSSQRVNLLKRKSTLSFILATNQSLVITCMSSECSLPGTCNHWLKLSNCMVRLHSVNTFPQLLMISNIEFSRNNLKFGKFDYRIWIKGKKLKQNF